MPSVSGTSDPRTTILPSLPIKIDPSLSSQQQKISTHCQTRGIIKTYTRRASMRSALLSVIGCLALALSGYALADCSGGEGCQGGTCNPYLSDCQCSDPICHKPMYSNCISRTYCCEAFGNIGAR
jgi:hypothetical protein